MLACSHPHLIVLATTPNRVRSTSSAKAHDVIAVACRVQIRGEKYKNTFLSSSVKKREVDSVGADISIGTYSIKKGKKFENSSLLQIAAFYTQLKIATF